MHHKKLILNTCHDCPHSFVVWQSEEVGFVLRYGCKHSQIKIQGVKEKNGRLVELVENVRKRPAIPVWCPLEDAV